MKKILIIHTNYKEKGGEDISVKNEVSLLKKKFDVRELYFNNKSVRILSFFPLLFFNYNFNSVKKFKKALNEFHPDLVYVHNIWFAASLAILKLLKKNNVPTAIKLHNYRYFCTKSISPRQHFNDGYCKACGLEKSRFQFINYYYKNSFFKNLLVYRHGIGYFKLLVKSNFTLIVLNNFQKKYLSSQGIDPDRINIIYNYIPQLNLDFKKDKEEKFILYAGRISVEKGVEELITSFLKSNLPNKNILLKIIGNGPDLNRLKSEYDSKFLEFVQYQDNHRLYEMISKSLGVVSATKLFEGQPTLFCEASMLKTVSIFPSNEGIKEFFSKENIFGYVQEDYRDLTRKLNLLTDSLLVKQFEEINFLYTKDQLNEENLIIKFEKLIENTKL